MIAIGEWIPFTDHPGQTAVRTIYFWRTKAMGDWYSQDSRLFSEPPLLRFIVPAPPEDAVRAALSKASDTLPEGSTAQPAEPLGAERLLREARDLLASPFFSTVFYTRTNLVMKIDALLARPESEKRGGAHAIPCSGGFWELIPGSLPSEGRCSVCKLGIEAHPHHHGESNAAGREITSTGDGLCARAYYALVPAAPGSAAAPRWQR